MITPQTKYLVENPPVWRPRVRRLGDGAHLTDRTDGTLNPMLLRAGAAIFASAIACGWLALTLEWRFLITPIIVVGVFALFGMLLGTLRDTPTRFSRRSRAGVLEVDRWPLRPGDEVRVRYHRKAGRRSTTPSSTSTCAAKPAMGRSAFPSRPPEAGPTQKKEPGEPGSYRLEWR